MATNIDAPQAATQSFVGNSAADTMVMLKTVTTTADVARKLEAGQADFVAKLAANLKNVGVLDAQISVTRNGLADGKTLPLNEENIISVSFGTEGTVEELSARMNRAEAAMNITMYEHGYGENLGIPGQPGTQGWVTAYRRDRPATTFADTVRQSQQPTNASINL